MTTSSPGSTNDPGQPAPANHLAMEQSPYLLQHVQNPVDWYPWGDEAFEKASREGKPIFLSIGYSTCHWCHVMAHECFDDEDVAALLNKDYIAVKVDREERPDIDQVYMEVCQRMTGSGGWPLTILMTSDALPFYAATYIPKSGSHGRPGLLELLPWVADKWRDDPAVLRDGGQQVIDALKASRRQDKTRRVDSSVFGKAEQALKGSFDKQFGGFGKAPKFPRPHDLDFLLRRHRQTGESELLAMVEQTLTAMRRGGIYDHLGSGFHRYSTDSGWLLPHFEKMLYDQAGLLQTYVNAFQVTGNKLFAQTVRELVGYLKRDLQSPESAFFSAEDADSEGVEGKFYVWNEAEIVDVLGAATAQRFNRIYNVADAGNFHDEATGKKTRANVLHLSNQERFTANKDLQAELAGSIQALFDVRAERLRPQLDDKIITAWNGMVISALVRVGQALNEPQFIADAAGAATFILDKLLTAEGKLLRRYRNGVSGIAGFSEDYAFLARGLLDLYAADFNPDRLTRAIGLADDMFNLFQDEESGVLYDIARDGEQLVMRPRTSWDGAMPAAGSIALEVYARLHLLTGKVEWRSRAEQLLGSLSSELLHYPAGYTQLLQSAAWLLEPTREVVVSGKPGDPSTEELLAVVRNSFSPETVALFRSAAEPDALQEISPFVGEMTSGEDGARAYVCQNFACQKPLTDPTELESLLARPPKR